MKGSLKTNQFLPGYSIIEQIYSGTRTIVYRGIRQQDQKPVIIKTMRSEYPNLHEIAQFRNQYAITKNLNLSGIVKTYSLEHYRNRYAIVMEDFGGISLQQWIEQNRDKTPLNLELFIDIAIQIASILDGLHRHRIIHKDIKPANILIHPSSKEVRIIDFSISSVVPTEAQSLTNLKILEGTLSYISPEQTGRMNRGLDYRTDFYSLGITLFELLTGRLPFPSSDRTELIYCHIAKEPPRANSINPNIPPILSQIIAKLMAKNAEDRYQSASGLKHDLEICKQKYQKTKTIDSFELATKDISDRFLIPEKLYGRHREVETLLAAYQRVTAGKTEVILVTGDPGVGKTAVVNEIHKPILRQRSYFIKGKFDQFQRNIPFSAWLEAFRDLIRQLLSESDKEIEQWKANILSALGDQAQVIINVIPQLEQIIGQQPPVAELPGIPAENRFNLLFQRFIQVFSNKDLEREDNIFIVVNQLNLAQELITAQVQRDELARMNLLAGRKALASTAYVAAMKYLTTGIKLLTDNRSEKNYELTLALYEAAAKAAYLAGEFEQMKQFVQTVLVKAKTLLDKVKIYEITIQSYGAQNQAKEAIITALKILKELGVELPENPTQSELQKDLTEISLNLADRSIQDLVELPNMKEPQALAAMLILSRVMSLVYQAAPELFPLFACKQVDLSLKYGNAPSSSFAYVVYGTLLCGVLEDIESGYKFGKLGLNLLDKFNVKDIKPKILFVFNSTIAHWKKDVREVCRKLQKIYSTALEMGDLEYAAYALIFSSIYSYWMGKELSELKNETIAYSNAIKKINQEISLIWNEIYRQTIFNLCDDTENPWHLVGEAYDESKMLLIQQQSNDVTGLFYLYLNKLHLAYLFHLPAAVEYATVAEKYIAGGTGQLVIPIFYFYDSLAWLAAYSEVEKIQQQQILEKVKANQLKMHRWADSAPMNYLHKYYLVEAEKYRVLQQYLDAIDYYDCAIFIAKENGYINEEALANELAGRFYLEWGKQKIAQTYLVDAYYCYIRWGAQAKAEDLSKRYPELLASVVKQEQIDWQSSEQSYRSSYTSTFALSSNQTFIGSQSSISNSLDLTAIIKASQALSGEIEMEQLLSTLMKVVMENAGASKCALILSAGENAGLTVSAVSCDSNTCIFPNTSLELNCDVPITLINYVKRTKEISVIDDARLEQFLASDRYIVERQPQSLLSIPILNQGKFLGILYLENNLTTKAFTPERTELLKVITTQAAISLKNAILYKNLEEYSHTLEEKVEQRTQQLHQNNLRLQEAIQKLQSAQTQLIQSEKMSSLGQMVAGIAHEINNPISFIHGNLAHARDYVQNLLDLIAIYQQEYPHPTAKVVQKTEEIDLNFLQEDLPKLLDSMEIGTSRICNIVLGLRNFSRLDEAEMKAVDIHEGIDNTLMILQHRLQAKGDRPEISVIKEYGQLPKVTCYAGQLNQVFMNILSNAIDALEQKIQRSRSVPDGISPCICIRTELTENQTVKILIADNGIGMTAEVKQKIFDPFFTTKPVGSGTGLGLSISYQIIVEKHKGQLSCNSIPGSGTEFVMEIPLSK